MAVYKAYAFFSSAKTGKTGLTVTVDVTKAADDSLVATNQAANEVRTGLYSYSYTSANKDDYLFMFKTTDTTVDMQNVPALTTEQLSANLDGAVSEIPASVWNTATSGLTSAGSIGKFVIDLLTAIPAAVWNVSVRTLTSFGTLIADIVAAILGGGTSVFVYSVTNSVSGLPIEGVLVRVTTDIAGVNTIGSRTTDSFGNVTFYLNPGTYYFWSSKDGFNFVNPDTEIVT